MTHWRNQLKFHSKSSKTMFHSKCVSIQFDTKNHQVVTGCFPKTKGKFTIGNKTSLFCPIEQPIKAICVKEEKIFTVPIFTNAWCKLSQKKMILIFNVKCTNFFITRGYHLFTFRILGHTGLTKTLWYC